MGYLKFGPGLSGNLRWYKTPGQQYIYIFAPNINVREDEMTERYCVIWEICVKYWTIDIYKTW